MDSKTEEVPKVLNPWRSMSVEKPPFVCPGDEDAVDAFNSKYFGETSIRLHLDLIPAPYAGDFDACHLLILMGNPGFSEAEVDDYRDERFRKLSFASLRREPLEYPFYFLDPRVRDTPGGRYWTQRLGQFISDTRERIDCSKEEAIHLVSRRVAAAELHPYHSANHKFPKALANLHSSKFTAYLAQCAIGNGAQILVARGYKHWLEKLGTLPEPLLVPRSPQADGTIRARSLYRIRSLPALPALVD